MPIMTLSEFEKAENSDAEAGNTMSLDSFEKLSTWSAATEIFTTSATSYAKGFASDVVRIPDEIGSLIKETGEKGGAGMAIPSFNDGVNISRKLTGTEIERGPVDDLLINAGEMLSKKNQEFVGRMNLKPEEGSRLSKIMFDLGAGTSSVVTSLGLLYATRSPSLLFGLFGSRQKAQIYEESRESGKDPFDASMISSAAGLVEGGVEALGGIAFLKAISFDKFITRSLLRTAEQGLEEGLQQTGEEAITHFTGVRKDSLKESALRVGYATALGLVLGAPAGAITSALENTQVRTELKELGLNDDQVNKVITKVSEKTIADGTVKQELARFLEDEIKVTEKAVNENPVFQSVGAMAADEKFEDGDDIYAKNFAQQQKQKGQAGVAYETTASYASKIAEPISTRLKQIAPKLKYKVRRFESDLKQQTLADEKAVLPFLEAYQKLSARDEADLDLALKNNDKEKLKEITKRNKMEDQYKAARETLDALYERGKESGLDIGFLEDYYPRKVKDREGMLKYWQKQDAWPEMQKTLNEKEESLGRKLNDDEKIELLNTFLKGSNRGKASKPGNLKTRQINQVTPELNQFYQKSPEALMQYIYRVNDFLEARRFFGKAAKGSDLSEQTIDASIGAFVLDQLEAGKISGHQAKEVSEILRARFLQRGASGIVSSIKNLTYIETMGSVSSAITQIGDVGFSLYKNGYYATGKSLLNAIAGKSLVTKDDLALQRIAEEFSDRTKLGKALDTVFKLTGLNWMDNLGKETFINGAFERLSKLAENPTPEFSKEMDLMFEDSAEQVIKDLQEGNVTPDVKFLLFSELADVQPIALSEMPEYYLTHPNGRFFYMLKTYTIKQIDVFRNEVFLKMKDNPAEALGNLVRLTSMVMLANATADVIKDLLLNRPLVWPDYLVNNIWRLFGVSRYSFYKFKTEGVSEGVASIVLPPVASFVTNTTKDVQKMLKGDFKPQNAEVVQGVPFLGKLYYWWFGGGKAKLEKKQSKGRGGRTSGSRKR